MRSDLTLRAAKPTAQIAMANDGKHFIGSSLSSDRPAPAAEQLDPRSGALFAASPSRPGDTMKLRAGRSSVRLQSLEDDSALLAIVRVG